MIPGTYQRHRAQRREEGLGPPPGQACVAATLGGQVRSLVLGMVGIEPPGGSLMIKFEPAVTTIAKIVKPYKRREVISDLMDSEYPWVSGCDASQRPKLSTLGTRLDQSKRSNRVRGTRRAITFKEALWGFPHSVLLATGIPHAVLHVLLPILTNSDCWTFLRASYFF